MESYTSMMRRRRRQAEKERKQQLLNAVGEIIGGIAFFALVFGIGFLCTICSGYHWE